MQGVLICPYRTETVCPESWGDAHLVELPFLAPLLDFLK
jgi:hypothetical protein